MKEKVSVALAAGMAVAIAAFGGGVTVSEGKIVDPADFGFSPDAAPAVNAAALQKALDGGKRTVRVSKPGVYGLDRNVYIDSDTTLDFAPGTVLKKMKPYQHVLVNRGAYNYGCDSNIVVRNLEIRVNKMEKDPDPNSNAPGLNGHISFYRVKNVACRNLTCTDFERSQYCYHAVDFDGIVVDGFVIRGGKDGIHLNRGRNFVVRNGVLRTLDDGIAVNAGEWPGGFTPVMGSIENGLVENVVDEDGGKCNFARVITGCWKEWHPGMKLQRCDIFNVGKNVYTVFPMPLGTNEYVSMTAPTHKHGVWKSPEGINFLFLQDDGETRADIRNVTFRNIRMNCKRSIACYWENCEWARLVHPEIPPKDYPVIDIRVENVVKTVPGAIVAGNASADIVFDNVKSEMGPILTMWRWSRSVHGTPLYATVHNITVTNCVFDGESRMDFNFFDPDGKGTLTLVDNKEIRPVGVRAAGDMRQQRLGGKLTAAERERPLARFGIISDIHLNIYDKHRSDVFRAALKYMDKRKADGIVACGDLTDLGTTNELYEVGAIWNSVFPGDRRSDGEHIEKLFIYGDHDTEPSFSQYYRKWCRDHGVDMHDWLLKRGDIVLNDRAKQWKAVFHEDFAPIMRKRVKGFDFVLAHLVNLDQDGMRRGDPLHIPGLEEFFATNKFDSVRPFFYVQHKIPKGTVGGPTQSGQDSGRTSDILANHPNAISLNGHKHRSATEELSLWQGAFTAIQAPALYKLLTAAGRENGVCSCDTAISDPPQQMAPLNTVPDGSHVMFMTIWTNRITVDRVDVVHGCEPVAAQWVIPWPNDGSASFEARGKQASAPQFAPGAKVSARLVNGQDRAGKKLRQIEVRFPPAQSTATTPRAYDYEVQAVLHKALVTRIVSTKRVYSSKCYLPERYDTNDVTCLFGRFEIPNNHDSVTFEVRPLNAWGRAGKPITSAPAEYDRADELNYQF